MHVGAFTLLKVVVLCRKMLVLPYISAYYIRISFLSLSSICSLVTIVMHGHDRVDRRTRAAAVDG